MVRVDDGDEYSDDTGTLVDVIWVPLSRTHRAHPRECRHEWAE